MHSFHDHGAISLDAIGARLVHRLSRADVGFDLIVRERTERDLDGLDTRYRPTATDHGYRGKYRMSATGKAAQHRGCVGMVARLAKDVAIENYDRVSADDDAVRLVRGDGFRLGAGQAFGVVLRPLARQDTFIEIGRADLVRNSDERQQLATPRRLRGENDPRRRHRSSHNVTGPSFTSSTSIIAPNS